MRKLLIALSIFYWLSGTSTVLAIKEFKLDYTSTYEIIQDNPTRVRHDIRIQNNLANIFTTNYTISVGSNKLEKISASDESGVLPISKKTNTNTTTIEVTINDPSIGKDQAKDLTISYTNPDIIEQNGKIREINIPKLANANEIDTYTRRLIVPKSFPPPSITLPVPTSVEQLENSTVYTFTGHKSESITLFFGDHQLYEIDLSYTISNPTLTTTDTEIAIPPDTAYQKIYLEKITPEPIIIRLDNDGNWLAIYSLEPQQSLDINVSLIAKVTAKPSFQPPPITLDNLTSSQQYWETTAPNIKSLANQLKDPKNIYNYLVNNFVYSYSRVTKGAKRLGASQAIINPTQAICTEFTDAFVALARSNNIPAREINGYAYTTNKNLRPLSLETDILHAWPEYYNTATKTWIQIDPTWGHTTGGIDYFSKLDFNHITFVIHGQESSYPYPAGAYKKSPNKKDINVKISTQEPKEIQDVKTAILTQASSAITTEKVAKITNKGNTSLINYQVMTENGEVYVEYLAPYSTVEIPLETKRALNKEKIPYNSLVLGIPPLLGIIFIYIKFKKNN